jgi:hypothetical protein
VSTLAGITPALIAEYKDKPGAKKTRNSPVSLSIFEESITADLCQWGTLYREMGKRQ